MLLCLQLPSVNLIITVLTGNITKSSQMKELPVANAPVDNPICTSCLGGAALCKLEYKPSASSVASHPRVCLNKKSIWCLCTISTGRHVPGLCAHTGFRDRGECPVCCFKTNWSCRNNCPQVLMG